MSRDERGESKSARTFSTLHAFALVARRRGLEVTFAELRRSYVFSDVEPSSDAVLAMAQDFGLHGKRLRLHWGDLSRLQSTLPAILRLKDGSSIILEGFRKDSSAGPIAILRDPTVDSDALMAVDETRLGEVWDGEAILLKRRHSVTDEQRPFGLTWLIGQVLREKRIFRDIGLAALISTVFAIAPPFALMIVINRVLLHHSVSTLAVIAIALLLMIAFEMALGYLRRILTQVATTRIDGRLNLYILDKMLRLPMDFFERNPTGMIMSKLHRMWQIRHFLTGQLFGAFLDSLTLFGLVPVLLILEWRLAFLVLIFTGIIFAIVVSFIRPLGRHYGRVVVAEQAKGAHLVESIYGMRTIKSLALEGRRRHEWDGHVAAAASAHHAFGLLANYPQTLTLPFERLIYSGSFVVGAIFVLANPDSMSAGAIVAFSMLAMRVSNPLVKIAHLLQDLAEVRGAVGELASIMNQSAEQGRAGTGLRLPIQGDISFQDVRFRYSSDAPYALDGVTFRVKPGTILGIMGRSGSGKTTVTRLLQGLNPGYEGIIKIDGMDLREIDLHHLRTSIGVVAQENFLFRGSIRQNIAMAKGDATFAEIVRAAQLAGAEEFIERLPRGYDTLLEEGAANLSGGQRQRLAIARALLVDPAVLMLDEATSALDAESEAIINANLMRIAEDRTIICISHRLSMLVPSDMIIVMENGKVYDMGRHEELLHRCDIYKHLWHQQNRHIDQRPIHAPIAIARAPGA
jgi:subfamily B ATP-binding cassette protein HlyB/CyaB